MRLLPVVLLLFVLGSFASAEPNQLTPAQVAEGWISLFDGETLFGWQGVNEVDWQVVDGEIRASEGEAGWLMTTSEFADYELHVEFKATESTNSGILLRSLKNPAKEDEDCYEVNIAPTANPFPTGSIVKRGSKVEIIERNGVSKVRGLGNPVTAWDGKWHSYDILIKGDRVVVALDGTQVRAYQDPQPRLRGHIGLQFNQGKIAFRNIRLKPLGTEADFQRQRS